MKFIVFRLKSIKKLIFAFILLALLCLNIGGGTVAGVYLGQSIRKVPIYSVQTQEAKVAISFDAAWGADKTEKIVEICKEHNVNATFFLVGFWIDKYEDMVKLIDDNGFEIGTHSNTHPDLCKLDKDGMKFELETSVKKIEDITSKKVTLFRAPYGSYNNDLIDVADSLGLKTIQWDVDSLDWKGLSAEQISLRILNGVKNGSIILCHNNSDHILDALPIVLDRLQKKGFSVTNVGDLIYQNDYSINSQGIQIKNS